VAADIRIIERFTVEGLSTEVGAMSTIRRYDSRKLYDPTASRYVSLEEIAARIRAGEEVEVLDNATGENVTAATLMQIILEEGKSGRGRLPSEVLHDLVRVSGEKISSGAGQVQTTMNKLMRASLDRLAPIREARRDIARLEERLRQLEGTLSKLDKKPVLDKKTAAPYDKKAAQPRKGSGGGGRTPRATRRSA
jgi:polyhydroxyalkanoate synthesis repressor PhaR